MNPKKAVIETEKLVKEALNKDLDSMKVKSPEEFKVQIEYKEHKAAYKNSFYPGAEFIAPRTVEFKTKEYYEVLRMIHFLT